MISEILEELRQMKSRMYDLKCTARTLLREEQQVNLILEEVDTVTDVENLYNDIIYSMTNLIKQLEFANNNI